eukprot:CAMPEP_0184519696 /NCGR_PEP_ID=MMETSP0198_2-20121128/6768_1 /TAXON_ID=1112570 /ORGANISM="Thraustochytrium sp., Strain LLF1b" /LENGTH=96 /DNA_ID=CAMNT_0026910237 /DNA_START=348 /DNA_END=639 /DNA_ORIENTATION=-
MKVFANIALELGKPPLLRYYADASFVVGAAFVVGAVGADTGPEGAVEGDGTPNCPRLERLDSHFGIAARAQPGPRRAKAWKCQIAYDLLARLFHYY